MPKPHPRLASPTGGMLSNMGLSSLLSHMDVTVDTHSPTVAVSSLRGGKRGDAHREHNVQGLSPRLPNALVV